MVIGYDASRAFERHKTGTENYSYQLLKALSKIDQTNTYIIYLRPNTNGAQRWPDNFKFVTIRWPRLWTQAGLANQTFKDNLDVLFIPAHTSPLIHRPGLKTVVTVHDLGAEYLPKHHQLKQRLYLKWITRYQLKHASKLIAVSEATKKDLIKKVGIDAKAIKVIYEGLDSKLFRPIKGERLVNSLNKFDLKIEEYFLFVGTVQPRKNLERLIRAFQKYVSRGTVASGSVLEARLVIVGSKGWLSDSIYKLPRKLGIENQVRFLGRVEDKELPALYSGAIALTFPSLFEGFGLPILEAQACGCPVLTSNTSSMPEVACLPAGRAGKGAILVDPYSPESIKDGMVKITNKDLRFKIKDLGFKNARRFNWEKCAKETLKVLKQFEI